MNYSGIQANQVGGDVVFSSPSPPPSIPPLCFPFPSSSSISPSLPYACSSLPPSPSTPPIYFQFPSSSISPSSMLSVPFLLFHSPLLYTFYSLLSISLSLSLSPGLLFSFPTFLPPPMLSLVLFLIMLSVLLLFLLSLPSCFAKVWKSSNWIAWLNSADIVLCKWHTHSNIQSLNRADIL